MRIWQAGVAFAIIFVLGCAAPQAHYGEALKLDDDKTMSVAKLLNAPDEFDGEFVRVSGTVDSVCAKKGCWIRLTDAGIDETIFVKFTCPVEDERLVPMEAVGHVAVVEGTLTVEEVSEDEARHYAEDAGKSEEEIAKIVGPQKSLRLASPAALIKGVEPPDDDDPA